MAIMMRKFVIPGLLLLLIGTVALDWVLAEKRKEQKQAAHYRLKHNSDLSEHLRLYKQWLHLPPQEQTQLLLGLDKQGKTKTKDQLLQEQTERLKADLDKLVAGEMDTYPYADILYGENWRDEVSKYKKRKELRESILTGSIVCTSVGGAIFTCCLLIWTARLSIKGLSRLKEFLASILGKRKEPDDNNFNETDVEKEQEHPQIPLTRVLGLSNTARELMAESIGKEPKIKDSAVSARLSSSALSGSTVPSSPPKGSLSKSSLPKGSLKSAKSAVKNADQAAFSTDSKPHTNNCKSKHKLGHSGIRSPKNAANIDVLLSDEESIKSEGSLGTAIEAPKTSTIQLEDSLKIQVENLAKQVGQIRQITGDASLQEALKSQTAQDVQQAVAEQSGPLNNTLMDLSQQVAAIREYASGQQDRVKKLQEGYDLNIIKNFCLRVIRCIDNLESCIGRQSEQNNDITHLKEARDELLFALESSGVEQFEPEINSDYRGQEKHAEAIKDKVCCDDPSLAGKIAQIIRPGYQYFIDEENVKVVRPAMVKLFG